MGNRYADHVTPLYPQKLALTSPTGGGRSVGIVRSRTKATELVMTSTQKCMIDILYAVHVCICGENITCGGGTNNYCRSAVLHGFAHASSQLSLFRTLLIEMFKRNELID